MKNNLDTQTLILYLYREKEIEKKWCDMYVYDMIEKEIKNQ